MKGMVEAIGLEKTGVLQILADALIGLNLRIMSSDLAQEQENVAAQGGIVIGEI